MRIKETQVLSQMQEVWDLLETTGSRREGSRPCSENHHVGFMPVFQGLVSVTNCSE